MARRGASRKTRPWTWVEPSPAADDSFATQGLAVLPPLSTEDPASPLLACAVVPALPLQILALRDPAVRDQPAVVVSEDRPQGIIQWTNRAARALGVLPGMRYAAALALHGELRAGVVAEAETAAAVSAVAALLRQFSPRVEPSRDEPGVFWLDAAGLTHLFGSMPCWAEGVRQHLLLHGWHGTVAVGWQRFALYAIARHFRGVRVCRDPAQETRLLERVELASLGPALGLAADVRDALALLGIQTLGRFLQLPPAALRERHGKEAFAFHRLATGALALPLRPELPAPLPSAVLDIEPPDDHTERLLFAARGLLVGLTREVAVRRQAVAAIRLELELEKPHVGLKRDRDGNEVPTNVTDSQDPHGGRLLVEVLRPAEPTLQEAQLVDLIRLKLEHLQLPSAVERMRLTLQPVQATTAQLRLWQLSGRRDLDAATLALARLRAAFGPEAVVYAELRPNHLPEARFAWQPLLAMVPAQATGPPAVTPLMRRICMKPLVLPSRPRHEPDGWLLADWRQGNVVRLWGPFRVTGGWWVREVKRDYYYVETERGDLLWVFWDGARRQWFLQGVVD